MSILNFLGLTPADTRTPEHGASPTGASNTDTVRRIVSELEALPEDRARYLATFAYVLGRVAHADSHFSEDETRKMQEIVQVLGHLPEAQAILIVDITKSAVRLFGGTENYVVTRQFKKLSTSDQRTELMDCVFAVSSADESISVAEEGEARRISKELGLTHDQFLAARASYLEHVEALKSFRRQRDG